MDICEDIELYLKESHSIEEKFNWRKAGKSAAMAAAMATSMGQPTGHAHDFHDPPTSNSTEIIDTGPNASEISNLTPKFAVIDNNLFWDRDGNLIIHGNISKTVQWLHGANNKTKFDPDKIFLIGYDANYAEMISISVTDDAFVLTNNVEFSTKLSDPEKKIKYLAFETKGHPTGGAEPEMDQKQIDSINHTGGKVDASFSGITDLGSEGIADGGRARILHGKINLGTGSSLDKLVLIMYDANHREIRRLNMKTEKYFSLNDDGEFDLGLPNDMKWKKIKSLLFINQL
jgi:hypothetical protein